MYYLKETVQPIVEYFVILCILIIVFLIDAFLGNNRADSTYAVSYQSGGYRNCVVNNNIAGHNFIISGWYTNGPIIRECTIAYNEVAALYEQYILGYIASIHNSIVWNYYENRSVIAQE